MLGIDEVMQVVDQNDGFPFEVWSFSFEEIKIILYIVDATV